VLQSKALTDEDRQVIRDWAKTVQLKGPDQLLTRPDKWRDHALVGKWAGHRASNFSYKGRIIYKIEDSVITVTVVKLAPDHNY
jgi:mRNA-degrading endonuclease YafQ of YafQ-DinJ toxin-antitoxin module